MARSVNSADNYLSRVLKYIPSEIIMAYIATLLLSTLSFAFWLFAMGGPFVYMKWYEPALGAIALPFFTLLVPIITGRLGRWQ